MGQSCDDWLADLHKKPAGLEFQGCKQTDLQGAPLEAKHRVAGDQAAKGGTVSDQGIEAPEAAAKRLCVGVKPEIPGSIITDGLL